MTHQTNQNADNLYTLYCNKDIAITPEVIREIGIVPHRIMMHYCDSIIPCIIYSMSMTEARIIAKMDPLVVQNLENGLKDIVFSLSFRVPQKHTPVNVNIEAEIFSYSEYDSANLYFINLEFLNKPPDGLVLILGNFLKSGTESFNRKKRRILINSGNLKSMDIKSDKVMLLCNGKKQECILRDVSFSGAKVVIKGTEEMFFKKRAILIMELDNIEGIGEIICTVVRCENLAIKGPSPYIALGLFFDKEGIPPFYHSWLERNIDT